MEATVKAAEKAAAEVKSAVHTAAKQRGRKSKRK